MGFAPFSLIKKAVSAVGKVAGTVVKTAVKVGQTVGVLPQPQPPAYIPDVTPTAGPPATTGTAPAPGVASTQPFQSALDKLKADLGAQVSAVAKSVGEKAAQGLAEPFTKAALETEAAKKQKLYLMLALGGVGLVAVLALLAAVSKRRK